MRYLCSPLVVFLGKFLHYDYKEIEYFIFSVNLKKNYPKIWENY